MFRIHEHSIIGKLKFDPRGQNFLVSLVPNVAAQDASQKQTQKQKGSVTDQSKFKSGFLRHDEANETLFYALFMQWMHETIRGPLTLLVACFKSRKPVELLKMFTLKWKISFFGGLTACLRY